VAGYILARANRKLTLPSLTAVWTNIYVFISTFLCQAAAAEKDLSSWSVTVTQISQRYPSLAIAQIFRACLSKRFGAQPPPCSGMHQWNHFRSCLCLAMMSMLCMYIMHSFLLQLPLSSFVIQTFYFLPLFHPRVYVWTFDTLVPRVESSSP
jgi:hypothetical protein